MKVSTKDSDKHHSEEEPYLRQAELKEEITFVGSRKIAAFYKWRTLAVGKKQ